MTTSEISQYLGLALAIIAVLGHAKGYFSSGEKQLAAQVIELKDDCAADTKELKEACAANTKKLIEHDRRIQSLEGDMEHLPDRESQHRIELNMEKLNGRIDILNETLKPIKANGELLNELLREQVKNGSK